MRKSRLNRLVLCGLLLVACGLFVQVRRQRVNSVQYAHDELVEALRARDEATLVRRTTLPGYICLAITRIDRKLITNLSDRRSVYWNMDNPAQYSWHHAGIYLRYIKTAEGWQLDLMSL